MDTSLHRQKTCGQGLGSGWQHWDILHHYDHAIRHQILQAQTCQFNISDFPAIKPLQLLPNIKHTDTIHTNALAYAVKNPSFPNRG